jgi:hypothetical protein
MRLRDVDGGHVVERLSIDDRYARGVCRSGVSILVATDESFGGASVRPSTTTVSPETIR